MPHSPFPAPMSASDLLALLKLRFSYRLIGDFGARNTGTDSLTCPLQVSRLACSWRRPYRSY